MYMQRTPTSKCQTTIGPNSSRFTTKYILFKIGNFGYCERKQEILPEPRRTAGETDHQTSKWKGTRQKAEAQFKKETKPEETKLISTWTRHGLDLGNALITLCYKNVLLLMLTKGVHLHTCAREKSLSSLTWRVLYSQALTVYTNIVLIAALTTVSPEYMPLPICRKHCDCSWYSVVTVWLLFVFMTEFSLYKFLPLLYICHMCI